MDSGQVSKETVPVFKIKAWLLFMTSGNTDTPTGGESVVPDTMAALLFSKITFTRESGT